MLSHALFTTRSLAAHSYHIPWWDLGQDPQRGFNYIFQCNC